MTVDRLAEVVAEAIQLSLAAILDAHSDERLVGYALCTDDDLRTVYAVACTRESLMGQDPDWLFIPTEWSYDDSDRFFDVACRMLFARADATDATTFARHVEQSFQCLVAALKRLRSAGAVSDEVFLAVLSTDPGERLTALANEAVRELNSAELYRRYMRAND